MKYCIVVLLFSIIFAACSENRAAEKKAGKEKRTGQFLFAEVQKGGVASVIKLPGQLTAFQEVSIFPKVNGYVKSVLVDIGSKVPQGSLLMTLEAPELEQAVVQAKEKYARAKADFSIDKERYHRLLEASKTAGAISPLDLSTIKAKMEADSAVCNAEKANWEMQQTMLAYLNVTAPFKGVITERNVHPGALVSASIKDKPMLELKQAEHLRLQVDIPEGIAGSLKNKDTVSFYVSALQGKKLLGSISRKADNINSQYRSERIEIDVMNNDNILSPGMFADVVLYSNGNQNALSVPKSAVVTSTEKKYVLVARDGKVIKEDVTTGNATVERIEIYGALRAGDKVVVNANDEIKSGTEIN